MIAPRFAGLALAAVLCACAQPKKADSTPRGPVPADGTIRVLATPVALNRENPAQTRLGQLTYAGGVALTSPDTERLHGLSGLDVAADGRSFIAISDDGDLVRGRIALDPAGHLIGIEDVRLSPLKGENGQPLQGKEEGDAEAVTLLAGGGFAVSFERDHRVLAFDRPDAPARLVVRFAQGDPGFRLDDNGGVEALAAEDDSLIAGTEGGQIRTLAGDRLTSPASGPEPPSGFSLTGLDAVAGGDWLAVYRAYDPFLGARAVIAVLPRARCIRPPCEAAHGRVDLARLASPLTVDNFEAISAVPLAGGGWRIYLLSDDNFQARQRTLLMAFDWTPHRTGAASGR